VVESEVRLATVTTQLPSKTLSLGISVVFAVAMFVAATALARRTTRGDLQ
jgi:hypothetical protein